MTRKKQDTALLEQELTHEIIGSFYTVYNELGYGFLENVFANGRSLELRRRNLHVAREVPVEVQYLGQPIGRFRMDLVVDHKVRVEIKSTSTVGDADRRQVFNYLKASVLPIALLLHFGPKPDFQRFAPRACCTPAIVQILPFPCDRCNPCGAGQRLNSSWMRAAMRSASGSTASSRTG